MSGFVGEQKSEWMVGARSLSVCVGGGWAHESAGSRKPGMCG